MNDAAGYLALAGLLAAGGTVLLFGRNARKSASVALLAITCFGTLTFAPPASDYAVAATCSSQSGHHSSSHGGHSEHNPPVDGDGVCQWDINPSMPVIDYSGIPVVWIKFDYTSILSEIQPTDCTIELHYYEDFDGDTEHDPNDPSSWSTNADIAGLIGDPVYNATPGIIVWTPGSTTNFILTIIRDSISNEVVASYPSNVFDAVPPP